MKRERRKILYLRKIIGALLIIFLGSGVAFADNFCNGYKEGYKKGYQDALRIPGLDPMVPICPIQPISQFEQAERDYQNGYKQGYSKGYKQGKEKEE